MLVVVIVFVVLCLLVMLDMIKPRNFPKGPMWFPVIGSALSVAKSRKETGMLIKGVRKIALELLPGTDDVIGFKIGKDKVVFAISTDSTIEMFLNPDLDGRPYGPFYETRTWNLRRGILLTDEGFEFKSGIFQSFCQSFLLSIRLLANSTSLHPTALEEFRIRSQRNARNL